MPQNTDHIRHPIAVRQLTVAKCSFGSETASAVTCWRGSNASNNGHGGQTFAVSPGVTESVLGVAAHYMLGQVTALCDARAGGQDPCRSSPALPVRRNLRREPRE